MSGFDRGATVGGASKMNYTDFLRYFKYRFFSVGT